MVPVLQLVISSGAATTSNHYWAMELCRCTVNANCGGGGCRAQETSAFIIITKQHITVHTSEFLHKLQWFFLFFFFMCRMEMLDFFHSFTQKHWPVVLAPDWMSLFRYADTVWETKGNLSFAIWDQWCPVLKHYLCILCPFKITDSWQSLFRTTGIIGTGRSTSVQSDVSYIKTVEGN